MARFSIGTAIGDAFGLIRRRPLSVWVWGLLLVAPSAATFGLMLPMMGEMIANMPEAAADGGMSDPAFAEMMRFQAVSWLLNLIQLALTVLVYTAIMRAVLRPRESAFFSLRLGMDELRVAVVGVAVIVGLYVAMIVMALIGVGIGFGVWGLGAPLSWTIIIGMVVVAILAIWLGMARISLIAPASVLYRSFAFPEGWRLARKQAGPLFGMMMLLVLIIFAIEAIVIAIGVAIAATAGASGGQFWSRLHSDMDANPFEHLSAAFAANWPWVAFGAVVVAMIYGALLTLGVAPFASACRQLAGDPTPPEPETH